MLCFFALDEKEKLLYAGMELVKLFLDRTDVFVV